MRRDALNALECLRDGGWIAFHDFLPRNWREEHVPRLQDAWTGDCWKLAFELADATGIDYRILKIDHGVLLMQADGKQEIPDLTNTLREQRFEYFFNNIDRLKLLDWEDGLAWIKNRG